MTIRQPVPPGWGRDKLTTFLDTARTNQFATFARLPDLSRTLVALDAALDRATSGIADPESLTAALLLIRGHAAFRAGASLAMAGQCPESYALTRLTLECGAYALANAASVDAAVTWLSRHESEDARKAARAALSHGRLREAVQAAAPALLAPFTALYEEAIDRGAHPNERAVTGSMALEKSETGHEFQQRFLENDRRRIAVAGRALAQAGLWLLLAVEATNPPRFAALALEPVAAWLKGSLWQDWAAPPAS